MFVVKDREQDGKAWRKRTMYRLMCNQCHTVTALDPLIPEDAALVTTEEDPFTGEENLTGTCPHCRTEGRFVSMGTYESLKKEAKEFANYIKATRDTGDVGSEGF